MFYLPVSERNKMKTQCSEVGECDDCRNGKSFEKTTEELGFLSVNLELELGFGVWFGVGFFGGVGAERTEKSCQCKKLILFLPFDFST